LKLVLNQNRFQREGLKREIRKKGLQKDKEKEKEKQKQNSKTKAE
jgi:hypothetical protein